MPSAFDFSSNKSMFSVSFKESGLKNLIQWEFIDQLITYAVQIWFQIE